MTAQHEQAILAAKAADHAAHTAYKNAVIAAARDPDHPASVRELAKLTGLAPSTVDRWKGE